MIAWLVDGCQLLLTIAGVLHCREWVLDHLPKSEEEIEYIRWMDQCEDEWPSVWARRLG